MVLTMAAGDVSVCFLMLAHERPDVCARLARQLLRDGDLAIHLDATARGDFQDDMRDALGNDYDRILWAERVSVGWGEWSMVQATLNGLEAIRRGRLTPDYVYLLSGADYPIRPLWQLKAFLARNPGTEFIESRDAESDRWVRRGIQHARYRYRHWLNWRKSPRLFSLSIKLQRLLRLERSFPPPFRPHMGSQWWVLTWRTCETVLDLASDPALIGFFRTTWVPDELFFQTVVRHVVRDQSRIDGRHLTHYLFTGYGVPLVFHNDHFDYLCRQPYFFARKISPHASSLRTRLDQRLADCELQVPPDDGVGHDTGEYKRFIEQHSGPHPAQRVWGHLGAEPLGELAFNTRSYLVFAASDPAVLKAAMAELPGHPALRLHGRLFQDDPIPFAGEQKRFAGYGSGDTHIRDHDRRAFLVDLIESEPERTTGYFWQAKRAAATGLPEEPGRDMLAVHARDPNAVIVRLDDVQVTPLRLEPREAPVTAARILDWSFVPGATGAAARQRNHLDDLLKLAASPAATVSAERGHTEAAGAGGARAASDRPAMRLWLHIGVHRTGSTALQKLLSRNRDRLLDQGFYYPEGGENQAWLVDRFQHDHEAAMKAVAEAAGAAAASGCHDLVLSSEDFSSLQDIAPLAELEGRFDTRVIVYLRRQDLWLESWYNQNIKWPWSLELSTLSPAGFLDRRDRFHWIDYAATLKRWSAIFGADRLVVRPFEKSQLRGSLAADFCQICGIDLEALETPPRDVNASAPPQAVEFMRHLGLIHKHGAGRFAIIRAVTQAFRDADLDQVRHFWSDALRLSIVNEFAESNAEVATRWLGRDDGRLFLDPLPTSNPAKPDLSLPPLPVLAEHILAPVVNDLTSRIVQLRKRRQDSEGQPPAQGPEQRELTALLARRARARALHQSPGALLQRLVRQLLPGMRPEPDHLVRGASGTVMASDGSTETAGNATPSQPSPSAPRHPETRAFADLLLAGQLAPRRRQVFLEALDAWQAARPDDTVHAGLPDDALVFTTECFRPFVDILSEEISRASEAVELAVTADTGDRQALQARLGRLRSDVHALEARTSTPAATARQLWTVLRHPGADI